MNHCKYCDVALDGYQDYSGWTEEEKQSMT